jgi:hypothetical protein
MGNGENEKMGNREYVTLAPVSNIQVLVVVDLYKKLLTVKDPHEKNSDTKVSCFIRKLKVNI